MTIEDETGVANAVIWPKVLERERKVVMGARLVVVHGRVQRHEDIIHVVATRLEDRSDWLHLLSEDGEAMEVALANADEVRRPDPGSWRGAEPHDLPLPLSPADHVKHPEGDEPRDKGGAPSSPLAPTLPSARGARHPKIPRLPLMERRADAARNPASGPSRRGGYHRLIPAVQTLHRMASSRPFEGRSREAS